MTDITEVKKVNEAKQIISEENNERNKTSNNKAENLYHSWRVYNALSMFT
jgi:hypothetical protein